MEALRLVASSGAAASRRCVSARTSQEVDHYEARQRLPALQAVVDGLGGVEGARAVGTTCELCGGLHFGQGARALESRSFGLGMRRRVTLPYKRICHEGSRIWGVAMLMQDEDFSLEGLLNAERHERRDA